MMALATTHGRLSASGEFLSLVSIDETSAGINVCFALPSSASLAK